MSDFTTVFHDDFNGSQLDTSIWRTLYSGQYGNGMFRWDPGQIEVGGGKLTIATEKHGGNWLSGGLSTIPDGLTHGRYEFSARFEEGQGTAGVVLLWPSNNQWTDEVNIIETNDPSRDSFAFTNHGTPWVTEYVRHNIEGWHTYTLDWTPGELALSIDGREVARIDHDVPSQQMSFGMQGQVMAHHESWFGGGPDGSTPDRVEIEVDWVRVSEWTPGRGNAAPAPQAEPRSWDGSANWEDSTGWEEPAAEQENADPMAAFTVDGQVDWHALAAHVTANYEATGQWFI